MIPGGPGLAIQRFCYHSSEMLGGLWRDRELWVICVLGALLRLVRIQGDLPYVFHFDEPTLVNNAVWLIQRGSLDPRFFNYPTGYIYILAALYNIAMLVGGFAGRTAALAWLGSHTYPQPPAGGVLYFYPTVGLPALYILGRCVTALAGIALIPAVYHLSRRVRPGGWTALAAAFLVAVSPLAVENSRLVTTDMPASLLALLCAIACLRIDGERWRGWVVAGALAGLAAGIKYNAGLVLLLIVPAAVAARRVVGRWPIRSVLLGGIAAAAIFTCTTPYAVLDWKHFSGDLQYEFHRISTPKPIVEAGQAIEITTPERVGNVLWFNLGPIGLAAAILGIAGIVRRRRREEIVILLWLGISLLPMLNWKAFFPRYMVLPWPALLLFVAWGMSDAHEMLRRRFSGVSRVGLAVVLAFLVVAPGAARLTQRFGHWLTPDPRIAMTAWIEANIPAGERIVNEKAGAFPQKGRYSEQIVDYLGRSTPEEYVRQGVRYLCGSGREREVRGEAVFLPVLRNLEAIRKDAEVVWARDAYTIYRLRGLGWDEPLQQALAKGDRGAARAILEGAARAGDDSPILWQTLAEIRISMGDSTGAMEAYERATRSDPNLVEPVLAMAGIALAQRDLERVGHLLDRALALAPRDPIVHHNIAIAGLYRAQRSIKAGDRRTAQAEWEKAREAARLCATIAPGDPKMTGTLEQVERMGARWGMSR
jgi:4-amino-4-deoxy-L-arabinose transferase-like glycosyltransferase